MQARKWWVGVSLAMGLGATAVVACGGGDDSASPGGEDSGASDTSVGADTFAGDSEPSQDAGDDSAAAKAAACNAITSSVCHQLSICDIGPDMATCAVQARSCPDVLFADGSNFTVDEATACAAQLNEVGCARLAPSITGTGSSPPLAAFPACRVPGTRAGGEPCKYNAQCASLFCASPQSNTVTAANGDGARCGTCAPIFGPTDDCRAGINADPSAGGPVCPPGSVCYGGSTNRCQALGGPGSPCGIVAGDCDWGLGCAPNPDGGAGTCVTDPPAGSPCDPSVPCADNGYCKYADPSQADGGVCQPHLNAGDDCTVTALARPTCPIGRYCASSDGGSDLHCIAALEGQECNDTPCAPDLECVDLVVGQHVCQKRAKDGDPCGSIRQKYVDGGLAPTSTTVDCASGTCSTSCVGLRDGGPAGTCIGGVLLGNVGEACGSQSCTSCAPGARCTNGTCVEVDVTCN